MWDLMLLLSSATNLAPMHLCAQVDNTDTLYVSPTLILASTAFYQE